MMVRAIGVLDYFGSKDRCSLRHEYVVKLRERDVEGRLSPKRILKFPFLEA